MRTFWRLLRIAYHRSPGEFWLAGGLIARGVWFALPWFNVLSSPAYGMSVMDPARMDSIERWWGMTQILIGLLQLLTLGRGGIKLRLVGLGLGVAVWLFVGLVARSADPTGATTPMYFGFVLAYIWRAWQAANGK